MGQPAQRRPFIAAREPVVEHDAGPQPQRLQGNRDEPSFQGEPLAAGHRIAEQRDHPVIRGQPQRPVRCGESLARVVFPAPGSPTIRSIVAAHGSCVAMQPDRVSAGVGSGWRDWPGCECDHRMARHRHRDADPAPPQRARLPHRRGETRARGPRTGHRLAAAVHRGLLHPPRRRLQPRQRHRAQSGFRPGSPPGAAAIQDFAAIATDHPPVASQAEPDCGSPSGPQRPAQRPARPGTRRAEQAG